MATTQRDETVSDRSKIITCAICGCIHPAAAPCKPWGESHFCGAIGGRLSYGASDCGLCENEEADEDV